MTSLGRRRDHLDRPKAAGEDPASQRATHILHRELPPSIMGLMVQRRWHVVSSRHLPPMQLVALFLGFAAVTFCAAPVAAAPPQNDVPRRKTTLTARAGSWHELTCFPPRVDVYAGGAQQIAVSAIDDRGRPRDVTAQCGIEVADAGTVSVTSSGLVRSTGSGETELHIRLGAESLRVPVHVRPLADRPPLSFVDDVVPILTKAGCNGGGCHGKATGQNGFMLSLLGFDPKFDHVSLTRGAFGRRLGIAAEDTLLMRKATASMPHGGGPRLQRHSDSYNVLKEWLESDAPPPTSAMPQLRTVSIHPTQMTLPPLSRQQLVVTAEFSDGSRRDVTREAVYIVNEPDLAIASDSGLVETRERGGVFAVMVRFGAAMHVFHGTVPFSQAAGRETPSRTPSERGTPAAQLDALEQDLTARAALSPIDRDLFAQWRRLGVVPSPPVSDAAFIRRASLDICGVLPTVEEISAYEADTRADKRARLIDRLLDRPEYAAFFALKWADILQNRGRGYGTSRQRPGTALFSSWIRDSFRTNKPYTQFVSEIITASGSQELNPPTVWYRSVRTTQDYVESVAQAFLGVRIQCAQCHHHPFELWSQADYYGLAAIFARVGRKGGFADAEVPTGETIYLKHSGEIRHPRSGEVISPKPLEAAALKLGPYEDPRHHFAAWLSAPDNPFVARTMANRVWGHFFGRGIIHPIDDARSTNPPTNPQLLETLSSDFVASGFDVKALIRRVCSSYAYSLSSLPNDTNRDDVQSFARFYPRRLSAEVLLDALSQVTAVPTEFPGGPGKFPLGTRATELPDENVNSNFLEVFGRPARTSACECERTSGASLQQALELVNSQEVQRKLTAEDGYVERLIAADKDDVENVVDIFRRTLSRRPRAEEQRTALEFLGTVPDRREAYRSLLWSLLATNEFLFNL